MGSRAISWPGDNLCKARVTGSARLRHETQVAARGAIASQPSGHQMGYTSTALEAHNHRGGRSGAEPCNL